MRTATKHHPEREAAESLGKALAHPNKTARTYEGTTTRKTVLTLLLTAAILRPAPAQWTASDYGLVGASVAVSLADWSTTAWALRHDGWTEGNPLLGPHPSRGRLAITNLAFLAAYGIAETKLSRRAARVLAWLDLVTGVITVSHSLLLGAHFAMP